MVRQIKPGGPLRTSKKTGRSSVRPSRRRPYKRSIGDGRVPHAAMREVLCPANSERECAPHAAETRGPRPIERGRLPAREHMSSSSWILSLAAASSTTTPSLSPCSFPRRRLQRHHTVPLSLLVPPPPPPAAIACRRRPRPAPLLRRLGAPPSSNRFLRRSSAVPNHPFNLPRIPFFPDAGEPQHPQP
jgi:hypothetical protein